MNTTICAACDISNGEQEAGRKLEFSVQAPPVVLGVCTADNSAGEVFMETWVKVGTQRFASGHQVGDKVMLAAKRPDQEEARVATGRLRWDAHAPWGHTARSRRRRAPRRSRRREPSTRAAHRG